MGLAFAAASKSSNLRTRVIAAAVLLPVVLLAFTFGPSWFVVLFLMMSLTLCVYEMATMLLPAFEHKLLGRRPQTVTPGAPWLSQRQIFPLITIALGWLMLLASTRGTAEASIGGVVLAAMAALLIGVFSSHDIDVAAARAFGILISLCYGAMPWLVVWQLYRMGPHASYIMLVMVVTWGGDTGGYFGGRYFGGKVFGDRKMAPLISPKKTWEGAVCGLAVSVVGALLLNLCFLNEIGTPSFIARLAVGGGIAAQLGDLVESTFKRFSGVKDSGVIIPGHGGFLDRVDGILFAAPVIWAILYYFR